MLHCSINTPCEDCYGRMLNINIPLQNRSICNNSGNKNLFYKYKPTIPTHQQKCIIIQQQNLSQTLTCMHACLQAHTHTCTSTHTHMHKHTHTHAQAHTHTCTSTHTHMHMHTHIILDMHLLLLLSCLFEKT